MSSSEIQPYMFELESDNLDSGEDKQIYKNTIVNLIYYNFKW